MGRVRGEDKGLTNATGLGDFGSEGAVRGAQHRRTDDDGLLGVREGGGELAGGHLDGVSELRCVSLVSLVCCVSKQAS